jgi:hypothetical protein
MNQSWIDEFEKEINMTNECGMELIILGDINIDYKDGCTNSKWSNMILDQSLTQLIDKPTRVTSTTSSIIDHVNVSHPEHIIETNVPIFAISVHYPVCITRKSINGIILILHIKPLSTDVLKILKRICSLQTFNI